MPGSTVAEANALRRNTPAAISSSADALTCRPIRMLRARPGRASRIISPRMIRTGSTRAACNAGPSANRPVAATAPNTRNAATRQSPAGIDRLTSPRSAAMVDVTA